MTDHAELVAFIETNIADDEQAARGAMNRDNDWWWDAPESPAEAHIARWDPARVLDDCDAKRRILRLHRPNDPADGGASGHCVGCGYASEAGELVPMVDSVDECPTLRALAVAYRARPGYREEWKP